MIKYQLNCKKCHKTFDSWFASSREFEKLKKMKLLSCNSCNSSRIEKSVMSPRISSQLNLKNEKFDKKNIEVKSKIKEFQNYIEKNLDYVGENFSYEARSIHYGDKKNKKGIYGKASKEEITELREEGIETTMIPWLKDKEN
tara:strand:+ start:1993 stop:2418 length:426 start_codon:yes stop_codon:yes gene_type:complete